MENYLKAILHAYPLLKTVGEDYAEHIRNKAVLSYHSPRTTEELAEYLAEEILRKNDLLMLRGVIEKTVERLDETERALVGARYFGKKKIPLHKAGEEPWSERKYFRRLEKVENKLGGMLIVAGITKEFFETRLMGVELIRKVYRHVSKKDNVV